MVKRVVSSAQDEDTRVEILSNLQVRVYWKSMALPQWTEMARFTGPATASHFLADHKTTFKLLTEAMEPLT